MLRAFLVVALAAGSAHATAGVQAQLMLSGGYDDSPPPVAGMNVKPDFFADIRPTLAFALLQPKLALRLSYTFTASIYADQSAENSYANRLELSLLATPTRTSTLALTVSGSESSLQSFTTSQPSDGAPIMAIPLGTSYYANARAQELATAELTPLWRLTQLASFSAVVPLGDSSTISRTLDLDQTVAFERRFVHDLVGAVLRVDFVDYLERRGPVVNPDGTMDPNGLLAPSQRQLITALAGRWRRDLGHFFAAELEAGALLAFRADDGGGLIAQPVGRAALHYAREEGAADLTYTHTVQPNVFVAQTFLSDTVMLRGAVPLPWPRLHLGIAASVAYQHGRLLDSTAGALTTTFDSFLGDATLTWSPRPGLSIFARYQRIDQFAAGSANPVEPLHRDIALVGLFGYYPDSPTLAFRYRPSSRVDGSDATSIPELHSIVQ